MFIESNNAVGSMKGGMRAFMLKLFDHPGPAAAAGGRAPCASQ